MIDELAARAEDRAGVLIALGLIVVLFAVAVWKDHHRQVDADTEARRRAVLRDLAHRRHRRHGRSAQ